MYQKLDFLTNRILLISVIGAIAIIALFAADIIQKNLQEGGLSREQILKADKEDIIGFEIKPPEITPAGRSIPETVIYRYVSAKTVPAETYGGLKEDISKRSMNSQTFLKSVQQVSGSQVNREYVSKIYAAPVWKKEGDKWYRIETATTTKTAFFKQTRLTLLDRAKGLLGRQAMADTYYASSGDGYAYTQTDGDWAGAHDATSATVVNYTATTSQAFTEEYNFFNTYTYVGRSFLTFDTSVITNSMTIVSATLNVYVVDAYDADNDGQDYMNVVQTDQPSSSALTAADFDNCGSTTNPVIGAAAVDLTGVSSSTYLAFTLNSTGRGWIKRSGETSNCGTAAGVTCLGLREGHDIENSPILGSIFASTNGLYYSASEETGTSQDPYLSITYISPDYLMIDGGTLKIDGGTMVVD